MELIRYIRTIVSTYDRKFSAICFITDTDFVSFGSRGVNPAGFITQCAPNSTLYSAVISIRTQPTCPFVIYLSFSLPSSSNTFPRDMESRHRKRQSIVFLILPKKKRKTALWWRLHSKYWKLNLSLSLIFNDLIDIDRTIRFPHSPNLT